MAHPKAVLKHRTKALLTQRVSPIRPKSGL
jgi:hypothetical protein